MSEELCLERHPIHRVHCWKRKGHDKNHWFAVSWESSEQVMRESGELWSGLIAIKQPQEGAPDDHAG